MPCKALRKRHQSSHAYTIFVALHLNKHFALLHFYVKLFALRTVIPKLMVRILKRLQNRKCTKEKLHFQVISCWRTVCRAIRATLLIKIKINKTKTHLYSNFADPTFKVMPVSSAASLRQWIHSLGDEFMVQTSMNVQQTWFWWNCDFFHWKLLFGCWFAAGFPALMLCWSSNKRQPIWHRRWCFLAKQV